MMLVASANANNCNSPLRVLESHLYEGRFNRKELNRVFFPQIHPMPGHVKVEYKFEGNGIEGGCSVTYHWSVGGFLLFQPPSVF